MYNMTYGKSHMWYLGVTDVTFLVVLTKYGLDSENTFSSATHIQYLAEVSAPLTFLWVFECVFSCGNTEEMTLCYNVKWWVSSLCGSVDLLSPQGGTAHSHWCLDRWRQGWVRPWVKMSKLGPISHFPSLVSCDLLVLQGLRCEWGAGVLNLVSSLSHSLIPTGHWKFNMNLHCCST